VPCAQYPTVLRQLRPISDKLFVRPSPRFRSVSNCTTRYTWRRDILRMYSKIQPPPFTRPTASASHLNTHGDHCMVSRHLMHDSTEPLCVLFSTNGSNGHRPATTRPPYKLRWRETARKWKSNQYSAICAHASLFSIGRIRNSMSNRQAVEMGAMGVSSGFVQ